MWRDRLKRVWRHRTKIIGGLGMAAGFAENNLAQLGHTVPERYHGVLLSALGMIVFCVGLYNSFPPDDPQQ